MSKKDKRKRRERDREKEREREKDVLCNTGECKSAHHASHVPVREFLWLFLFRTFCRVMRETRWRARGTAASHPVPFAYVFTFSLSLGASGGGTERTGSHRNSLGCAVVLQIERGRGFCMLPLTSCAWLCSALAGTWNFRTSQTQGRGACSRRETFSVHLTLLCVCVCVCV